MIDVTNGAEEKENGINKQSADENSSLVR